MNENIRQTLTYNLNALLKDKKIKAIDLAEKVGVSKSAVSHWLAGDNSPNIEVLAKICQIYDIKMSDILSDKTDFSYNEKTMINKYRSLDQFGKKAVDDILNDEYERCLYIEKEPSIKLRCSLLKASAGTGNWLDDEQMGTITVVDTPEARKADIVIEVDGDSMEPEYSSGDKVLVRLQPAVEINEIGIFTLDGNGYIKKFAENRLISLNTEYKDVYPSEYSDFRCIGKVIGKAKIVE